MSIASPTVEPRPAETNRPAAVPPELSQPVVRPKKSAWQLFREVLDHGGPGYLQFAITNICNADCDFCGFARSKFDPKARRSVTLKEAQDAVDIALKNHIGYLLFVGGEPMVHRELRAMTRYAAQRGIHPMICTNGGLWTEDNMRGLADDGLSSVIMSVDAHDIAKHEKNRGLPDVCRKIKGANESLTEMQRHLRQEPEKFGCLGGHKYFYLDWKLNLYRCHYWETPMCNVYDWDESKLIRDGCTRCMIDCYRDPSVLQRVAINASDAWNHLRKGQWRAAARNVFGRRNVTSSR